MMCDTRGADPCVNLTFCVACREADQRKARGERPHHIDASMWNRRPTRDARDCDSMSLEQLWDWFKRERPTPQVTIEAIMYCIRDRGVAAMKEPANIERLLCCDAPAKTEINRRIARLVAAKEIAA
jgi:hypothetical protein